MKPLIKKLDPPFDHYSIYSDGRIWSEASQKFLSPYINNAGYKLINLWAGAEETKWLVHRLVATCFVPNPNKYNVVNHIDGDRLNNDFRNLEWTTQGGNLLKAQLTGLSCNGGTYNRQAYPYMLLNFETGECFIFVTFRDAVKYCGVNEHKYAINEKLRKKVITELSREFHPIPNTTWGIRLAYEYDVGDFEWDL